MTVHLSFRIMGPPLIDVDQYWWSANGSWFQAMGLYK